MRLFLYHKTGSGCLISQYGLSYCIVSGFLLICFTARLFYKRKRFDLNIPCRVVTCVQKFFPFITVPILLCSVKILQLFIIVHLLLLQLPQNLSLRIYFPSSLFLSFSVFVVAIMVRLPSFSSALTSSFL